MAYATQDEELCIRDVVSEIFCVFRLNELVVFGLNDQDRNADSGQILHGVVGLRLHHDADGFSEDMKLVGCGGELGVVLRVA